MTPTLSPTALRKVLINDFQGAVSDFIDDVPAHPDDYTMQAITTLLGHLRACESYLLMLRYQAERIERCAAMRGMAPMSGGMDRWNDFCHAVTQLEIHAVPYSVPDARNTEWIGGLMRGLDAAWAAFAFNTDALRGMVNDIGPASYEAAEDAAATALAQPSLRERLGRAPLASDGVLP